MAVAVYQPLVRGKKINSMASGERATESKSPSIGGITTTLSESNHEMLAIKIIIPPKPKGMNPGPYCVSDDDNSGTVYSTFPVIPGEGGATTTSMDYEAISKAMEVTSQSSIDVKSLISQDEDLAASKLPFVWKLYEMLEDVEANGREDIVSWIDQGSGFKVHNMEKFVDEVIPKYFRQSKYKSFQRQLYFYDFHRVSNGPHAGAYKHPKFLKGVKTQCLSMMPKKTCRRRSSKGKVLEEAEPESACSNDVGVTTEESSTCGASTNSSEEWMSAKAQQQQQQPMARERYSSQAYPSYTRDRHSSSLSFECGASYFKNETKLRRSGPGDGDTVFVFGDRAFHFVEVTFDDIYPPSCSDPRPTSSSRYHHHSFQQDYRDIRATTYGHAQIEGI